jgi:hypothetical protein
VHIQDKKSCRTAQALLSTTPDFRAEIMSARATTSTGSSGRSSILSGLLSKLSASISTASRDTDPSESTVASVDASSSVVFEDLATNRWKKSQGEKFFGLPNPWLFPWEYTDQYHKKAEEFLNLAFKDSEAKYTFHKGWKGKLLPVVQEKKGYPFPPEFKVAANEAILNEVYERALIYWDRGRPSGDGKDIAFLHVACCLIETYLKTSDPTIFEKPPPWTWTYADIPEGEHPLDILENSMNMIQSKHR